MKYWKYIPLAVAIPLLVTLIVLGQRSLSPAPFQAQIPGASSLDELQRFRLDLELTDQSQIELDYELLENEEKFAVVRRADLEGRIQRQEGDEAVEQIKAVVENLPSLADAEDLTLMQAVLEQQEIQQQDLSSAELEYLLVNGLRKTVRFQVDALEPKEEEQETIQQTDQSTPQPTRQEEPAVEEEPMVEEEPQQTEEETEEETEKGIVEDNENDVEPEGNNEGNDDDN